VRDGERQGERQRARRDGTGHGGTGADDHGSGHGGAGERITPPPVSSAWQTGVGVSDASQKRSSQKRFCEASPTLPATAKGHPMKVSIIGGGGLVGSATAFAL